MTVTADDYKEAKKTLTEKLKNPGPYQGIQTPAETGRQARAKILSEIFMVSANDNKIHGLKWEHITDIATSHHNKANTIILLDSAQNTNENTQEGANRQHHLAFLAKGRFNTVKSTLSGKLSALTLEKWEEQIEALRDQDNAQIKHVLETEKRQKINALNATHDSRLKTLKDKRAPLEHEIELLKNKQHNRGPLQKFFARTVTKSHQQETVAILDLQDERSGIIYDAFEAHTLCDQKKNATNEQHKAYMEKLAQKVTFEATCDWVSGEMEQAVTAFKYLTQRYPILNDKTGFKHTNGIRNTLPETLSDKWKNAVNEVIRKREHKDAPTTSGPSLGTDGTNRIIPLHYSR